MYLFLERCPVKEVCIWSTWHLVLMLLVHLSTILQKALNLYKHVHHYNYDSQVAFVQNFKDTHTCVQCVLQVYMYHVRHITLCQFLKTTVAYFCPLIYQHAHLLMLTYNILMLTYSIYNEEKFLSLARHTYLYAYFLFSLV